MSEFADALKMARIVIKKYDETQIKSVHTSKSKYTPSAFTDFFREALGRDLKNFPGLQDVMFDESLMESELATYTKEIGVWHGEEKKEIPKEYLSYQLNMDLSAEDASFFLTQNEKLVKKVTGNSYMLVRGMSVAEAVLGSRKVVPEYHPRGHRGVVSKACSDGTTQNVFNTYVLPRWTEYEGDLPDSLPDLFRRLVDHLIPLPLEREFFFCWLRQSMLGRSPTYLVLSGSPGAGKGTLKGVMKALHGFTNTADGKLTTLTSNFNGPLVDNTLHWFDELTYTHQMEPRMKELPNKTVSIERKGVDATPSSDIFCSFVIANNDPRDNYLSFEARKFAPLCVATTPLTKSLSENEIDSLVGFTDESSDRYNPAFVAQIGRWIKRRGKSNKWPGLEYRGPMFWQLANDSMFGWQKAVVKQLLGTRPGGRVLSDPDKGYLFSSIASQIPKKNSGNGRIVVPDFGHVRPFLEIYRTLEARKIFSTEPITGDPLSDFWVKIIPKESEDEKDLL